MSEKCTPKNLTAVVLPPIWGWQGWYVLVNLCIMFYLLVRDIVRTEFAIILCVMMIWSAQIITTTEALIGFSNAGVLTVLILYVVAEGLSATGGVDYFMGKLMGEPKTLGLALVRMMVPVAFTSAFINNTPLVALMIPIIQKWSRKVKLPVSQLMIPLSYATILGGTITMIGTSTNLVVAGRARTQYCKSLGIFDLSIAGVPVAIFGMAYILAIAPYMLPNQKEYDRRRTLAKLNPNQRAKKDKRGFLARIFDRLCRKKRSDSPDHDALVEVDSLVGGDDKASDPSSNTNTQSFALADPAMESSSVNVSRAASSFSLKKETADFIMHAIVPNGSFVNDKNVGDAGLRGEDGVYLISVQRGKTLYSAVGRGFEIQSGDLLSFTGLTENFILFCSRKGLQPLAVDTESEGIEVDPLQTHTIQAVIRDTSDLIGKTPKEADFRKKYNCAILSIFRAGHRLHDPKLGQVQLKVGDLLVCITNDAFDWNSPETSRDLKPRHNFDQLKMIQLQDAEREDAAADTNAEGVDREFYITMKVAPVSKLGKVMASMVGKTVEVAGLRAVPGVVLFAVQRDGNTFRAIGPEFVLQAHDLLWFCGERDGVTSLRRLPGLTDVDTKQLEKLQVAAEQRRLIEVVLSLRSDMLYKTVREARFRSRFSAAIVAVHRQGAPILSTIGDVVLQPGDVLILDAGPGFIETYRDDSNFLLVAELDGSAPPRFDKFYIAFFTSIAMIALAAGLEDMGINLALLALWASAIMLTAGCLSGDRAMKSLNWNVIITVACAFGLSTALEKTYVAPIFGNAMVSLSQITNTGETGLLVTVMAATALLSSLVANNAAALLMFPIAAQAAHVSGIDRNKMLFALMFGASDYATPFGYQTNLMIYGPGGYVFLDYLKFGGPFMVWLLVVETITLVLLDAWYAVWIASIVLFLIVVFLDLKFRGKMTLAEIGALITPSCCVRRSRTH